MRAKIKSNSLYLIAIFILTFSLLGAYGFAYGQVYSIRWYILFYGKYALSVGFCIYAVFKYFKAEKIEKDYIYCLGIFLVPVILIFLYSIIIWYNQKPTFDFITRGVSDSFFRTLAYITGVSMAFVLKRKALIVGLVATLLTFGIGVLSGVISGGSDFFLAILNMKTADTNFKLNSFLELHEAMFIIAMHLVALIVIQKKMYGKYWIALLSCSLIVFFIGGKRIGFAALIFVFLYKFLMQYLSSTLIYSTKAINRASRILLTLGFFIYVGLSVKNFLPHIASVFDVNMMGRGTIYQYFSNFTNFNFNFFGNGVGFVNRQFAYTTTADLKNMVSIRALHNDLMRIFIDIGIYGFICWCVYWLVGLPEILDKFCNSKVAFAVSLIVIYSFVTYTTDNTEGYYNYQMQFSIIITALICNFGMKNPSTQVQNE